MFEAFSVSLFRRMAADLRGARGRARLRAWRAGLSVMELMFVLAIVGVVAAYAIPAYQDYLARSRVGEGLALASSARLAALSATASGTGLDGGYSAPAATR
ncbi:general secretion pathway protein GspH, partial [Burkholderia multivorans]|uniref:pilin n=1 Tax=Burkholderia multivorans TaxID=87883 RepID=UPI000DB1C003